MTGVKYDWVVRTRPDICNTERIRLDRKALRKGTVLLTSKVGGKLGFPEDKFFASDVPTMRRLVYSLGDPYNVIDRYYDPSTRSHGLGANPESFVLQHLKQVKSVRLPQWRVYKCGKETAAKENGKRRYQCPAHLSGAS